LLQIDENDLNNYFTSIEAFRSNKNTINYKTPDVMEINLSFYISLSKFIYMFQLDESNKDCDTLEKEFLTLDTNMNVQDKARLGKF
jgi:hypothetical protein